VSVAGARVEILIEDNGCGFDPGLSGNGRKGNGLGNMRKRTEGLGGRLELTSVPQKGTRLRITVGLRADKRPESERSGL
jgi:signal transduction histidine kinase